METKPLILIKYGGNAMQNESLQAEVIRHISDLWRAGNHIVLVHGGGPFIQNMLDEVKLESEFIGGHRKTSPEALRYIEMALKGEVNSNLVRLFNRAGLKAVGLSGKDGRMVIAKKRHFSHQENGKEVEKDLGMVGDVAKVNTDIIEVLLKNDYIPVITCIASDEAGNDFNINADMFAGHLAGALQASQMLVLTDIAGLMKDIKDPDSLIPRVELGELPSLFGKVIKGGMIPKVESCAIAIQEGAKTARIINGTQPETIIQSVQNNQPIGTQICL